MKSPQSNGISRAIILGPMAENGSHFASTLKRDCVNVTPLPDAATVLGLIAGWFEDYNENHSTRG